MSNFEKKIIGDAKIKLAISSCDFKLFNEGYNMFDDELKNDNGLKEDIVRKMGQHASEDDEIFIDSVCDLVFSEPSSNKLFKNLIKFDIKLKDKDHGNCDEIISSLDEVYDDTPNEYQRVILLRKLMYYMRTNNDLLLSETLNLLEAHKEKELD